MAPPTPSDPSDPNRLVVAQLRQTGATPFVLEPEPDARAALALSLGASAVRKLRFEGSVTPQGRAGWTLSAKLGATVVQPCIVSLEPVTTRIDEVVKRQYVPLSHLTEPEAGSETEVPEDDTVEPLGEVIDLTALMHESLALAMPSYPRKDGVALGDAQFAPQGVAPLTDETARPFAGLAGLKQKMQNGSGDT